MRYLANRKAKLDSQIELIFITKNSNKLQLRLVTDEIILFLILLVY